MLVANHSSVPTSRFVKTSLGGGGIAQRDRASRRPERLIITEFPCVFFFLLTKRGSSKLHRRKERHGRDKGKK